MNFATSSCCCGSSLTSESTNRSFTSLGSRTSASEELTPLPESFLFQYRTRVFISACCRHLSRSYTSTTTCLRPNWRAMDSLRINSARRTAHESIHDEQGGQFFCERLGWHGCVSPSQINPSRQEATEASGPHVSDSLLGLMPTP
jgi:hypothetical protein